MYIYIYNYSPGARLGDPARWRRSQHGVADRGADIRIIQMMIIMIIMINISLSLYIYIYMCICVYIYIYIHTCIHNLAITHNITFI